MIKINTTTIVMLAVFFMVQFVVGIPPFMYNDGYGSEGKSEKGKLVNLV